LAFKIVILGFKENENPKNFTQHATCNAHAQLQPNGTVHSLLKSALTSTSDAGSMGQVKIVMSVP
jgi:hypothetical protein